MERPVGESDEIRGRRSYMGRTGIQMLVRESIKKKGAPDGVRRHPCRVCRVSSCVVK
jgi:hypothetical protein